MKKISVIGHFAFGRDMMDGQTVKTKVVTEALEDRFSSEEVLKIDTCGGAKTLLKAPFQVFKALKNAQNVIMFPAHNGLRIYGALLPIFRSFFKKRKLHYAVIGGWLASFLKDRKFLTKQLKRFDGIYVETNSMKNALEAMGFKNIFVMPNCKKLTVLSEDQLVYSQAEPYKLCTFSRVSKEKGIGIAVDAVKQVNAQLERTVFSLDIYGKADEDQTEWFDQVMNEAPDYISYRGIVPFDQSVDVLKKYFALLFPTYYEGEGFAGTLIDAMAAGVPVIASDWKYNAEIVVQGKTGILLQTCDVENLAEQLIKIAENPVEWNALKGLSLQESVKYRSEQAVSVLAERI